MNWKVLAAGGLLALPLVGILASGFGSDPRAVSNALEGKPANPFSLQDLEGRTYSLSELSEGPVVLNFWASWCRPCAQEHPQLVEAQRLYSPRGVQFLGVLYGDEPEKAADFIQRHGGAWPTLIDPGNRVAIDYGVAGVPETFVLHRGQIVRKFNGPVLVEDLAAVLEPLL